MTDQELQITKRQGPETDGLEVGELFRSFIPDRELAEADFDTFVRIATEYQGTELHNILVGAARRFLETVPRELRRQARAIRQ